MSNLLSHIKRIFNFIRFDIWRVTEYELSQTKKFGFRMIKTVILAIRGFIDDKLTIKASALTYSILFAIVPMFALIIAIGKGFGVEKLIERALSETFIAQANLIPTVMGAVGRYLDTTQDGIFIGIGIIILLWSVMNFFTQVERAFNSIWQVKKSRSFLRQFSTYFSAMLILPLMIVVSSGLSIYINTELTKTSFYHLISPFVRFSVEFSPYFINWLLFTILYIVIPNTRVRFTNALAAGIIAGSAFQLFQVLYIKGQVYLSRYDIVYGSFAAIPLLLLWLQISCLIVLLGAEISYASQNFHNYDFENDTKNISNRYRNFLSLFLTYIIVKQFEQQKPALSSDAIVEEYKLPIRLTNEILTRLVDVNVIIEVYNDDYKLKTYQPAMDINQLSIQLLMEKLDSFGSEFFLVNNNPLLDTFWKKASDSKFDFHSNSEPVLIKDL